MTENLTMIIMGVSTCLSVVMVYAIRRLYATASERGEALLNLSAELKKVTGKNIDLVAEIHLRREHAGSLLKLLREAELHTGMPVPMDVIRDMVEMHAGEVNRPEQEPIEENETGFITLEFRKDFDEHVGLASIRIEGSRRDYDSLKFVVRNQGEVLG